MKIGTITDSLPDADFDTAMVMLTMASGALVHVNSSFRAVYGYDQRIEAFGEMRRPSITLEDGRRALRVAGAAASAKSGAPVAIV
jgi:myo-inositol 2-dehydrogenase / D-chiro-inositol 1-dehydrogenase